MEVEEIIFENGDWIQDSPMSRFCECDKELSSFFKEVSFLNEVLDYQLLMYDSAPWS
jgi:hypothetical protein